MSVLEEIVDRNLSEAVPLRVDGEELRVGATRVTLDSVFLAFESGATPEEIARDFPALRLDDVYAVTTFILRHRAAIIDHLERRRETATALREQVERRQDLGWLRQRVETARARAV